MAKKAKWSIRKSDIKADVVDGTATLELPLLDNGVMLGKLVATITEDRALRVEWQATEGAPALTDFRAWIRGES